MNHSNRIGLVLLLAAGCSAGPSPSDELGSAWEAASVNDETQSTHLWIVDRAIDLLRKQGGDATAANAVALLDRSDCLPHWHQGLNDADYLAAYNDGRRDLAIGANTFQIALAGSTWASHFYDPDSGLNYKGQGNPTARTRIADQLARYRNARASNNIPDACYQLGLALHYYTDLTQPMHASNYTATNWPLEMHTHVEVYALQYQNNDVSNAFSRPSLGVDALVDSVGHASKAAWVTLKGAIAASYGARCSPFDSYYKDHTECWQGDPGVDAEIASSLRAAQTETAQFLYALSL